MVKKVKKSVAKKGATERKNIIAIAQPIPLDTVILDVKGNPVGGYGVDDKGKPDSLTIKDALLSMLQTVDVGNAHLSFKLAVKMASEDTKVLSQFGIKEKPHLLAVVEKAGEGTVVYVRGFLEDYLKTS